MVLGVVIELRSVCAVSNLPGRLRAAIRIELVVLDLRSFALPPDEPPRDVIGQLVEKRARIVDLFDRSIRVRSEHWTTETVVRDASLLALRIEVLLDCTAGVKDIMIGRRRVRKNFVCGQAARVMFVRKRARTRRRLA